MNSAINIPCETNVIVWAISLDSAAAVFDVCCWVAFEGTKPDDGYEDISITSEGFPAPLKNWYGGIFSWNALSCEGSLINWGSNWTILVWAPIELASCW